ncbi:MAG: site-2 protease family protein [Deltaproteobacteria bacterium]|nr:site-2 protease family protein [Deltaproteobacteria bacterium]
MMNEAFLPFLALQSMLDPGTQQKIRTAIVMLIAFVLSVAVHEFGHAFLADRLGDDTPRRQGRVTLNPIAHADPIGTLAMPLFGALFGGFVIGWGKPVMINPMAFTRKLRMKTAHLLVALAGPMMNVVLAFFITGLLGVLLATDVIKPGQEITSGIAQVIYLNWLLFFFNLIPCPPLDGGAILAGLLPDRSQGFMDFLQQYGFIILIGLFVSGALSVVLRPALWMTQLSLQLVL